MQGIREGGDDGTPVASNETSPMGRAFFEVAAATIHETERRNAEQDPTKKVKVSRK